MGGEREGEGKYKEILHISHCYNQIFTYLTLTTARECYRKRDSKRSMTCSK
jgi:hypothetical protein